MSADSLSQALAARRGKGLDPSMIRLGSENASHEISEMKPQDVRKGFEVPNGDGADILQEDPALHSTVDKNVGLKEKPVAEEHKDQHIQVQNEGPGAMSMPASQSMGGGAGELQNDIRNAVTGHASQQEYDQLKDLRPRSLGERAKMMALKDQYPDKG